MHQCRIDAVLHISELQLKTCDLLSIHARSSTDSFLKHEEALIGLEYLSNNVRVWEQRTDVNKIDTESRKIHHKLMKLDPRVIIPIAEALTSLLLGKVTNLLVKGNEW
jgi:hypothetical protein